MYSVASQVLWENKTSFKKYLFYTHCVLGIVLSGRSFAVKRKSVPCLNGTSVAWGAEGGDTQNKQMYNKSGGDKSY